MGATVSSISQVAPIGDVYQAIQGAPLDGDGDERRGYCFAHADTDHPSASYNLVKDVWKCFSCDASGGVFDLVLAAGKATNRVEVRKWLRANGLSDEKVEASRWDSVTTLYQYTDAEGALKYEVGRWALPNNKKSFGQRAVKPDGSWDMGKGCLNGVTRVPYRLPLLLTAADKGLPVFVVEGEKDSDSLHRLGMVCTTNAQGSGWSWPADWANYFKGVENVYVLADNDEPGRACAIRRAQIIATVVPTVRVVYALPGAGDKGDVTDWITAGGNATKLREICEAAEQVLPYIPEYKPEAVVALANDRSDLGASRWLIEHFADTIRFVPERDSWFVYRSGVWSASKYTDIAIRSADLVKQAAVDAQNEELSEFAEQLRSATKLDSVMRIVRMSHQTKQEEFDAKPTLLNLANGTVELETGELREHRSEDLLTIKSDVKFDGAADCPRFKSWLMNCVGGELELFTYMQQILGSCLEARAGTRKFYLVFGPKGTGKSTFIRMAEALLGSYQCSTDFSSLVDSKFGASAGAASPHLAMLRGMRMVSAAEANTNARLDTSRIKQLIGGDIITARHLHGNPFQFRLEATLILTGNEMPRIVGDASIWDKFCPVPFECEIVGEDPNYEAKYLLPELSGILNFAISGLYTLKKNNCKLPDPPVVRKLREEQMADQDTIEQFVSECVSQDEDVKAKPMKQGDVRAAYADWCKRRRFSMMSASMLKKFLIKRGFVPVEVNGTKCWERLRLALPSDGTSRYGED